MLRFDKHSSGDSVIHVVVVDAVNTADQLTVDRQAERQTTENRPIRSPADQAVTHA